MIKADAGEQALIRETALRSIKGGGRRFWLLAAALGVLVAVGIAAYVYQVSEGLGVTGMNDQVFWGLYTVNFVTFIGISYGGAVVSAILRLTGAGWRSPITRLAEAMAVISLAIGGLFPIIHIGRPDRVWEMVIAGRIGSPLIWDMVAISTYLAATLVFFYLPLIPDLAICRDDGSIGGIRRKLYAFLALGWRDLPSQRKLLGWGLRVSAILIIPLAVSVHSVLAWAFAVTTRAGWHSTIFGPYFVVAALFSGIATVILVVAAFRKAYHLEAYIGDKHFRYLGYIMLVLGLAYFYFTFSEFLTEGYLAEEQEQAYQEALLLANFAPLFWLFLAGGLALPVLLIAFPGTRTVRGITVAAALAVGGMWLKRFLIVVPPLAGSSTYTPSWVESLVTIGALAAIPLFLMLLIRLFPVLSIWEMEEEGTETKTSRTPRAVPLLEGAVEVAS